MERLSDLLQENIYLESLDVPEPINASLEKTASGSYEVIVADNVAKYIFSNSNKGFVEFTERDFPNIAPVFDDVFIEWSTPVRIYRGDGVFDHHPEYKDTFVGVHVMSERHDNEWLCLAVVYAAADRKAHLTGWMSFSVNSDGTIKDSSRMTITQSVFEKSVKIYAGLSEHEIARIITAQTVFPAFMTLSFMHCKNVVIENRQPPPAVSRKYAKRHGRKPIRYKVLEIEPMKNVLKSSGGIESVGLRQAMHICRGHFKDFSKGNGLFGKYNGMYWWESQVRGSQTRGVVVKDYSVNPELDRAE